MRHFHCKNTEFALTARGPRHKTIPLSNKRTDRLGSNHFLAIWVVFACLLASSSLHAAVLVDGTSSSDGFGISTGISGDWGIIGAYTSTIGTNSSQGAAYIFGGLGMASGTASPSAELLASNGAASNLFGGSVSISGSVGLVGAAGFNNNQGATYVYNSLLTASGTTYQSAELLASNGTSGSQFGVSVSVSGNVGIVGAYETKVGSHSAQGAAYVYNSLSTASGTTYQNAELLASDGAASNYFGSSVSISGSVGIVGALGAGSFKGAAYVYNNLTTASGTTYQSAKLVASDGAGTAEFGGVVNVSGDLGLIGAPGATIGSHAGQGAAYVYDGLSTLSGTVTQNAKLIASDGAANDNFGSAVSVSGNVALVGANNASSQGAVYLFLNLDTLSGTATQDVKIVASVSGSTNPQFGGSPYLDGDQFIIGTTQNSGKAYTGSVSSLTTLDAGNTSRTIGGISFISQDNWIIGQTTNSNTVTLQAGNSANVTASGKAVYIGQNSTSNSNRLIVQGSLAASQIYVGAVGNAGNTLELDSTATLSLATGVIHLAPNNYISIEGNYTDPVNLFSYLGTADASLDVWNGSAWEMVNSSNYSTLIDSTYAGGITSIEEVPEPSAWLLLGVGGLALLVWNRATFRKATTPSAPFEERL